MDSANMRKLFLLLCFLLSVSAFARGGGFSSGRSSFSSGRSSFSSPRSYSAPKTYSAPTTKSFTTSTRGSFGNGSSKSRGGLFGSSSRGSYGMGSSTTSRSSIAKAPTTREVLSYSTITVGTRYHSVPIYYYYYPSSFYGSGYGFYHYYFWYHMFGNHSNCYHNGGGQAVVRKCDDTLKDKACYQGEVCELKTHECKLKDWQ